MANFLTRNSFTARVLGELPSVIQEDLPAAFREWVDRRKQQWQAFEASVARDQERLPAPQPGFPDETAGYSPGTLFRFLGFLGSAPLDLLNIPLELANSAMVRAQLDALREQGTLGAVTLKQPDHPLTLAGGPPMRRNPETNQVEVLVPNWFAAHSLPTFWLAKFQQIPVLGLPIKLAEWLVDPSFAHGEETTEGVWIPLEEYRRRYQELMRAAEATTPGERLEASLSETGPRSFPLMVVSDPLTFLSGGLAKVGRSFLAEAGRAATFAEVAQGLGKTEEAARWSRRAQVFEALGKTTFIVKEGTDRAITGLALPVYLPTAALLSAVEHLAVPRIAMVLDRTGRPVWQWTWSKVTELTERAKSLTFLRDLTDTFLELYRRQIAPHFVLDPQTATMAGHGGEIRILVAKAGPQGVSQQEADWIRQAFEHHLAPYLQSPITLEYDPGKRTATLSLYVREEDRATVEAAVRVFFDTLRQGPTPGPGTAVHLPTPPSPPAAPGAAAPAPGPQATAAQVPSPPAGVPGAGPVVPPSSTPTTTTAQGTGSGLVVSAPGKVTGPRAQPQKFQSKTAQLLAVGQAVQDQVPVDQIGYTIRDPEYWILSHYWDSLGDSQELTLHPLPKDQWVGRVTSPVYVLPKAAEGPVAGGVTIDLTPAFVDPLAPPPPPGVSWRTQVVNPDLAQAWERTKGELEQQVEQALQQLGTLPPFPVAPSWRSLFPDSPAGAIVQPLVLEDGFELWRIGYEPGREAVVAAAPVQVPDGQGGTAYRGALLVKTDQGSWIFAHRFLATDPVTAVKAAMGDFFVELSESRLSSLAVFREQLADFWQFLARTGMTDREQAADLYSRIIGVLIADRKKPEALRSFGGKRLVRELTDQELALAEHEAQAIPPASRAYRTALAQAQPRELEPVPLLEQVHPGQRPATPDIAQRLARRQTNPDQAQAFLDRIRELEANPPWTWPQTNYYLAQPGVAEDAVRTLNQQVFADRLRPGLPENIAESFRSLGQEVMAAALALTRGDPEPARTLLTLHGYQVELRPRAWGIELRVPLADGEVVVSPGAAGRWELPFADLTNLLLNLTGSGPLEREKVEALLRSRTLTDAVTFKTLKEKQDVLAFLEGARSVYQDQLRLFVNPADRPTLFRLAPSPTLEGLTDAFDSGLVMAGDVLAAVATVQARETFFADEFDRLWVTAIVPTIREQLTRYLDRTLEGQTLRSVAIEGDQLKVAFWDNVGPVIARLRDHPEFAPYLTVVLSTGGEATTTLTGKQAFAVLRNPKEVGLDPASRPVWSIELALPLQVEPVLQLLAAFSRGVDARLLAEAGAETARAAFPERTAVWSAFSLPRPPKAPWEETVEEPVRETWDQARRAAAETAAEGEEEEELLTLKTAEGTWQVNPEEVQIVQPDKVGEAQLTLERSNLDRWALSQFLARLNPIQVKEHFFFSFADLVDQAVRATLGDATGLLATARQFGVRLIPTRDGLVLETLTGRLLLDRGQDWVMPVLSRIVGNLDPGARRIVLDRYQQRLAQLQADPLRLTRAFQGPELPEAVQETGQEVEKVLQVLGPEGLTLTQTEVKKAGFPFSFPRDLFAQAVRPLRGLAAVEGEPPPLRVVQAVQEAWTANRARDPQALLDVFDVAASLAKGEVEGALRFFVHQLGLEPVLDGGQLRFQLPTATAIDPQVVTVFADLLPALTDARVLVQERAAGVEEAARALGLQTRLEPEELADLTGTTRPGDLRRFVARLTGEDAQIAPVYRDLATLQLYLLRTGEEQSPVSRHWTRFWKLLEARPADPEAAWAKQALDRILARLGRPRDPLPVLRTLEQTLLAQAGPTPSADAIAAAMVGRLEELATTTGLVPEERAAWVAEQLTALGDALALTNQILTEIERTFSERLAVFFRAQTAPETERVREKVRSTFLSWVHKRQEGFPLGALLDYLAGRTDRPPEPVKGPTILDLPFLNQEAVTVGEFLTKLPEILKLRERSFSTPDPWAYFTRFSPIPTAWVTDWSTFLDWVYDPAGLDQVVVASPEVIKGVARAVGVPARQVEPLLTAFLTRSHDLAEQGMEAVHRLARVYSAVASLTKTPFPEFELPRLALPLDGELLDRVWADLSLLPKGRGLAAVDALTRFRRLAESTPLFLTPEVAERLVRQAGIAVERARRADQTLGALLAQAITPALTAVQQRARDLDRAANRAITAYFHHLDQFFFTRLEQLRQGITDGVMQVILSGNREAIGNLAEELARSGFLSPSLARDLRGQEPPTLFTLPLANPEQAVGPFTQQFLDQDLSALFTLLREQAFHRPRLPWAVPPEAETRWTDLAWDGKVTTLETVTEERAVPDHPLLELARELARAKQQAVARFREVFDVNWKKVAEGAPGTSSVRDQFGEIRAIRELEEQLRFLLAPVLDRRVTLVTREYRTDFADALAAAVIAEDPSPLAAFFQHLFDPRDVVVDWAPDRLVFVNGRDPSKMAQVPFTLDLPALIDGIQSAALLVGFPLEVSDLPRLLGRVHLSLVYGGVREVLLTGDRGRSGGKARTAFPIVIRPRGDELILTKWNRSRQKWEIMAVEELEQVAQWAREHRVPLVILFPNQVARPELAQTIQDWITRATSRTVTTGEPFSDPALSLFAKPSAPIPFTLPDGKTIRAPRAEHLFQFLRLQALAQKVEEQSPGLATRLRQLATWTLSVDDPSTVANRVRAALRSLPVRLTTEEEVDLMRQVLRARAAVDARFRAALARSGDRPLLVKGPDPVWHGPEGKLRVLLEELRADLGLGTEPETAGGPALWSWVEAYGPGESLSQVLARVQGKTGWVVPGAAVTRDPELEQLLTAWWFRELTDLLGELLRPLTVEVTTAGRIRKIQLGLGEKPIRGEGTPSFRTSSLDLSRLRIMVVDPRSPHALTWSPTEGIQVVVAQREPGGDLPTIYPDETVVIQLTAESLDRIQEQFVTTLQQTVERLAATLSPEEAQDRAVRQLLQNLSWVCGGLGSPIVS